jgi:hypothetical protein
MAQLHGVPRQSQHLGVIPPGSTLVERVLGTVQPEYGAKNTKLNPSRIEFRIFNAFHVAADIVAPPPVADIGGRRGKIRLESQRLPGHDRVAGKADGVAMVAQPAPPGKDEGSFFLSPQVIEMEVIEPPERIQSRQTAVCALLPVQPPKIDTDFFLGVVKKLEISRGEVRIGDVKGDSSGGGWF